MKNDQKKNKAKQYWEKPTSTGGWAGWGLSFKEFNQATSSNLAKRAAFFTNPFNASVREDALNTVGLLSKAQKNAVQNSGILNRVFHTMIPGATAIGLGSTIAEGGDGFDYIADVAAPEVAAFGGWRAGKATSTALASTMTKSFNAKAAAGLVGGVTGAVIGGAATLAITQTIKSSADSNNLIKQTHKSLTSADFSNPVMVTQNTMTSRRRAMEQLSKSSLNNRGQILGNEASIMRGYM